MEIPVELLIKYEKLFPFDPEFIRKKLSGFDTETAIVIDGQEHFQRRRKMLAAVANENFEDAFERYNGENNLLPINYLQLGYFKSRSVGRLQFVDTLLRKPVVATGFLISPDLLLTNHHVLSSPDAFRDAQIEFNYEYDVYGREKSKVIFELLPGTFFYSNKELDYALVAISSKDKTGNADVKKRGYLVLNGAPGKAGLGDFASIIQHAEGHPMQIALRENRIIDNLQQDLLVYNADTSHGSSGSPVFNDEWQVIALHSAGVAKKNADGKLTDKDGNVIPEINGRVDSSKLVWISNQGIKVSAIIRDLRQLSNPHPFIMNLFSSTYTDDKQLSFLSLPQEFPDPPHSQEKTRRDSIPGNDGNGYPNVYININIPGRQQEIHPEQYFQSVSGQSLTFEKKLEDEMDFSKCQGFDEFFLGAHTPIPALLQKLKKQLAYYTDNPNIYLLKYHHYSTIHHAIRKMPVMSAVNINSTNRFRLSRTDDNWFRDRRIDFDLQLTDEFYRKSGFDKGHMSRREDAEWASSIHLAEIAANMTCSYTNACPQVPDINRAVFGYKGKWGGLEIELLEKAVLKEKDGAKICVYNGPVFSDDDPVFKGIQVPMKFWKIVVWRNASGKLKTTGFLLSQEELVNEIPFEALEIDKLFKTSQCTIRQIEKLTRLNFTKIRNWDTYVPPTAGQEETSFTKEAFEKFIIENREEGDDVAMFS